MKVGLNANMDFLAGLLLLTIGAGAFYMALDFPFGSALRMGPGFFPRVLAGILMGFGVFVLARGLVQKEPVEGRWGFKPLAFLIASLVAFGWSMEHLGFLPALAVLFVLAAAASHEFRWIEVLLLALFMSGFAYLVFIWGLGLPYPLFGAH